MVYTKSSVYLYLALSALLWIPGSHSDPNDLDSSNSRIASDQESEMTDMLASLPKPYNKVTIQQTFDAQIGDECSEEAWKQLTRPFWEQNFNDNLSASEDVYIKAHTGWIENPEFAGKSCFNNRHIRSGLNQIFPALPLKCVSGKCVCYKDVVGNRKFKLHQTEIKYQGIDSTPEDELLDCVGDVGANCNGILFPCDPKSKCVRQETGRYECVVFAPVKKEGKKMNPSVKKEIRNGKASPSTKKEMRDKVMTAVKDNIPVNMNAARSSVTSGVTVLCLGLFSSLLVKVW